jgi:hypothetical protein
MSSGGIFKFRVFVVAACMIAAVGAVAGSASYSHIARFCPQHNEYAALSLAYTVTLFAAWLAPGLIGLFQIGRRQWNALDLWRCIALLIIGIHLTFIFDAILSSLNAYCDASYWQDFSELEGLGAIFMLVPLIVSGLVILLISFLRRKIVSQG